ncbi:hypothetical protein C1646_751670 [Rhizophagus diaphanus]|nr:hypothetical protein C1646_751670 [Rhizophagus diaphanus] [Rhizophagus sp. MUCL 43196]
MNHGVQVRSTIRPPFPPLITIQDIVRLLSINRQRRPRRRFNAFNIYRTTTIFHMQINNIILPITYNYFQSITSVNWDSEASDVKKMYQGLARDTNTYYNL